MSTITEIYNVKSTDPGHHLAAGQRWFDKALNMETNNRNAINTDGSREQKLFNMLLRQACKAENIWYALRHGDQKIIDLISAGKSDEALTIPIAA